MDGRGKTRALASYLVGRAFRIAMILVLFIILYYAFTKRWPHRSTVIALAIGAAFSPAFYWLLWRVAGISIDGRRRTTKTPDVR